MSRVRADLGAYKNQDPAPVALMSVSDWLERIMVGRDDVGKLGRLGRFGYLLKRAAAIGIDRVDVDGAWIVVVGCAGRGWPEQNPGQTAITLRAPWEREPHSCAMGPSFYF